MLSHAAICTWCKCLCPPMVSGFKKERKSSLCIFSLILFSFIDIFFPSICILFVVRYHIIYAFMFWDFLAFLAKKYIYIQFVRINDPLVLNGSGVIRGTEGTRRHGFSCSLYRLMKTMGMSVQPPGRGSPCPIRNLSPYQIRLTMSQRDACGPQLTLSKNLPSTRGKAVCWTLFVC